MQGLSHASGGRARSLDCPFGLVEGFGSPRLLLTGMTEGFFRFRRKWTGPKDPSADFTLKVFGCAYLRYSVKSLYVRRAPSICVDLRRGARSSVSAEKKRDRPELPGRAIGVRVCRPPISALSFPLATLRKKRLSEPEDPRRATATRGVARCSTGMMPVTGEFSPSIGALLADDCKERSLISPRVAK